MSVFRFNRAIVRLPAGSVVNGLRAGDQESPSFEGVRREHAAYLAALRTAALGLRTASASQLSKTSAPSMGVLSPWRKARML